MQEIYRRQREPLASWEIRLRAFFALAVRSKQGIVIDYLYEPGEVVPQRLYRYKLYQDYLVRLRDDFEFGFDLIERAKKITGRRTYGVYVIELNGNPNHVYVGQTWYTPEERLQQHLTGLAIFHAAKPFKAGSWGELRPGLYAHISRFTQQAEAEAAEARLARELRYAGFRVEGGH